MLITRQKYINSSFVHIEEPFMVKDVATLIAGSLYTNNQYQKNR